MSKITIPEVSLTDYTNGDKAKFIETLGHAYRTVGFIAVKNHGINQSLIKEFYDNVESFFQLDTTTKTKYEINGLNGQRGYTSFGKEHAKGSDQPDLKEFWQFGNPVLTEPANIQTSELPDFNSIGENLFNQFYNTGSTLLKAIALYLNLDENYFQEYIENGNSILRAIHYPPITQEPKSAVRAEAHEDINLITLLVGASADGLELLDRNGQWQKVSAPEGYIIVNVGDMLQRLSNNVLRSTTHRVVNPPKELWGSHRYSIPFFLHPNSDMSLACLDGCITADNPKQYDDITAGEYLHQRLVEIGLA